MLLFKCISWSSFESQWSRGLLTKKARRRQTMSTKLYNVWFLSLRPNRTAGGTFLRASLRRLLSAERCNSIKGSVEVQYLKNDRAENASKVSHCRCCFYAIFNPSRSKYYRYVRILRYTKYACVNWENLFTLILQVEVVSRTLVGAIGCRPSGFNYSVPKTNLFQNLQMYSTSHIIIASD